MQQPKNLITLLFIVLPALIFSQDPFFTHFYGNEALFNPALTGKLGASSIGLKSKWQWDSQGADGYETYQLVWEESLPCSFFDYGLSLMQDMEGAGRLRTQQFGGMLAAPLRLSTDFAENLSQLRIGIGLHWGQQSVDYSRLLFIDQLHPKYGLQGPDGLPISTAFTAPNDGFSSWYFQPSGGVSFRYVINAKSKRASNVNLGVAVHNLVPWTGAGGRGHSWSLLGLGTPTIPRWSYFLSWEIVPAYFGRSYFSVRPQVFAQTQKGLAYLEAGVDFSLNRQITAGMFWHSSRPNNGLPGTNWGSLQIETGVFLSNTTRVDLGLGYSFNISGLRNYVNNIYEATVRISFASSPVCKLAGQADAGCRGCSFPCPNLRHSPRKRKIYENIWYRNN